jgi:Flp pilus assembly protein TadG
MTLHTRHPTYRTRHHRWGGDGGQVTAFVAVISTALILATGLVIDGGSALGARLHAADLAQEAARAGAQELDLGPYRADGQLLINPERARTAALDYLTRAGWTGTAAVRTAGATVTVTVRGRQPTTLLRLTGLTAITITGTAAASAVRGPTRPDPVPPAAPR